MISLKNQETKEQPKSGCILISWQNQKVQITFCIRNCVFWDFKVFLVKFTENRTPSLQPHIAWLQHLQKAIQNNQRGMLSSGNVLQRDNAWAYTAATTKKLLSRFRWEIFTHPPYCLDLVPLILISFLIRNGGLEDSTLAK